MPPGPLQRFIEGAWRFPREHYRVLLRAAEGGRPQAVPCPLTSYYADPFLLPADGGHWLFVEEYRYARSRARISALWLDRDLAPGPAAPALEPDFHVSFPFVFRHEGTAYMLPESSQAGSVELYACDTLPLAWRPAARLLEGVDCADSVLHRTGGLWYLITSAKHDARASRRWLEIHISDSLLSNRWRPHPVNAERRYADRDHGFGRNAGALLASGGQLLRPMQASTRRYGERMQLMRVLRLTPEVFEEIPFAGAHAFSGIADATHHVCQEGDVLAWDCRTR